MASASDPAEVDQEEQVHGQREPHDSSSTDASIPAPPSSAADVSPPPPLSSSIEGRTKQPADGGRGADGSSFAAAAVEQKGKNKIAASDDREQAEEERKSDPQKEKLLRSSIRAAYQGHAKKPSDDALSDREAGGALKDIGLVMASKLPWDDPRVWKPQVTPVSTTKKSPGCIILGYISNKFLCRKGSPTGFSNLNYEQKPLVQHQRIPLASAPEHYGLPWDLRGIISANLLILLNEYSDFRPVHGDGECFYRSFIISYLEQVLDRVGTDEENRLLAAIEVNIKPEVLPIDYPGWASGFSRSHKVFEKLIQNVVRWKSRQKGVASTDSRRQKLLEFFSSYSTSDDIFSFLRYVAATWMCSHREEYEPLIPGLGDGYTLENWCEFHLIQPREDTDHIQMRALAAALGVPVRVENLHNGPAHDIYTADGVDVPCVTLLYTGTHYDILYPRHPSGGSSRQQAGCFRRFW